MDERLMMMEHIEKVVRLHFPQNKPFGRELENQVRNANGFVGNGFVGVPMPDKERKKMLNALFGKGGW